MRRVSQKHILLAVILIGLAFRIFLIDRQSLWADELFSLAMATGHSLEHNANIANPACGDFIEVRGAQKAETWRKYLEHEPDHGGVSSVVRAVYLSDTNPPLYYILLHFWTFIFGTSDWALRSLSILFTLISFPLLSCLSKRIAGQAAVIPACILFTFAPVSLYFSTEGRMYSLCWLLVLMTVEATFRFQENRGLGWNFLFWTASSVAGFLTHYFFVFSWLALWGWLFLFPGEARRSSIMMGSALVVVLILPWYMFAGDQLSSWHVTSGWLNMLPSDWNFIQSIWTAIFGHLSGRGIWGGGWRANTVAVVLFALCVGTFITLWKHKSIEKEHLLLWMWLLVPVLSVLFLDIWSETYAIANYRYSSMGFPAAVLIVATVLGRWPRIIRFVGLGLIVLLWLPAMRDIAFNSSRCWTPFREVAKDLSDRVRPEDVVIVHSIPSGVLGIARYVQADMDIVSWVEQLGLRKEGDLDTIVIGKERVFLVRAHEVWAPVPVEDELHRKAVPIRQDKRDGISVSEYDLTGAQK